MAKELSKATIRRRQSTPEPTDEILQLAHVIHDAALIPDRRLFEQGDTLCADRIRFADAARTTYAAQFPRCTDIPPGNTILIVQRVERFTVPNKNPEQVYRGKSFVQRREWQFECLFCRESLQTLGEGTSKLTHEWWEPLHYHTLECAARFVLGTFKAPRPKAWQLAKDDPKEPRKPRKRRKR